ncbi:MAG: preprotein translocase subunit SecG, partial [Candidatus Coatesbacteria bacterium]|nr:preprotein translocase subunit SecG [Candidatus Coatesbacteria bacterium]
MSGPWPTSTPGDDASTPWPDLDAGRTFCYTASAQTLSSPWRFDPLVTALIVVHVLLCVGLCITVLLQAGKGGGLSGAFGGAGAQTVLGKRGAASFLAKLTRWMAIGFMLLSLGLAFIYSSASPAAQVTDAETTEE